MICSDILLFCCFQKVMSLMTQCNEKSFELEVNFYFYFYWKYRLVFYIIKIRRLIIFTVCLNLVLPLSQIKSADNCILQEQLQEKVGTCFSRIEVVHNSLLFTPFFLLISNSSFEHCSAKKCFLSHLLQQCSVPRTKNYMKRWIF